MEMPNLGKEKCKTKPKKKKTLLNGVIVVLLLNQKLEA
jgi:hypothetical protein